ncbi:VanZ family protein [Rhodococcus sp. HNM0563]|uniref:VanZ family protein n=1 Tax=Rhodococcus sp. HNM0563 TaxID=2716339 RepID=UPI00146D8D5A|nr:VanZ family protein [Rhodococcus sp. HNM0563]NLU64597.1 VanZ family protein [Rhodococcus sp. HNM0563]
MDEQLRLGASAIFLGFVAGTVMLVPFVAASYRRHGSFPIGRALTWAAALTYGWGIWTYTLLPLPDPATLQCADVNTDLFAFTRDIDNAWSDAAGGPVALLADTAFMQLALNVLLFVPLGFFLRTLGGRGVVTAGAVGLGLSAFIEFTQLTGVWGLYPCAYRVFDVDDLLTNTVGAIAGSMVALLVPRRLRGAPENDAPGLPRPVTKPRRLLAMVCDLVGYWVVTAVLGTAVQAYILYVAQDRATVVEGRVAEVLSTAVSITMWFVLTMLTGRTLGDHAVRLRYTGGSLPTALTRLARFAGGIGGYGILAILPGSYSGLAPVFAFVALVTALSTRNGRGLPGVLARQDLSDSRTRSPDVRVADR